MAGAVVSGVRRCGPSGEPSPGWTAMLAEAVVGVPRMRTVVPVAGGTATAEAVVLPVRTGAVVVGEGAEAGDRTRQACTSDEFA
ncbi:hypothetical protein ETC03_22380 [Geobacillus sp. MMMUD3]|nr:hypothetical protein [Geobacillus sp. MMMUD3]